MNKRTHLFSILCAGLVCLGLSCSSPGVYVPKEGERITEWRVEWLKENKRGPDSIAQFMKENEGAEPSPER